MQGNLSSVPPSLLLLFFFFFFVVGVVGVVFFGLRFLSPASRSFSSSSASPSSFLANFPSSSSPLQIDFAATRPRRNAITLSLCSLFYPCPFLLFRLRSLARLPPRPLPPLAPFLPGVRSSSRPPPFICPSRETSRCLIAGMGLRRLCRASNQTLEPVRRRSEGHGYRERGRLENDARTTLDNAAAAAAAFLSSTGSLHAARSDPVA